MMDKITRRLTFWIKSKDVQFLIYIQNVHHASGYLTGISFPFSLGKRRKDKREYTNKSGWEHGNLVLW